MQVVLNGEPREIPQGTTVADLIRLLGLDRSACAAEVNQVLVPRREHETAGLVDGDRIELVTLVGGG
jgi:sulfur carrier protein